MAGQNDNWCFFLHPKDYENEQVVNTFRLRSGYALSVFFGNVQKRQKEEYLEHHKKTIAKNIQEGQEIDEAVTNALLNSFNGEYPQFTDEDYTRLREYAYQEKQKYDGEDRVTFSVSQPVSIPYSGPLCQDKKSALVKIQNPPSLLTKNSEGHMNFMPL